MTDMVDRILAGEVTCPGEVRHFVGTGMVEHLAMHADGRCVKGATSSGGHWHPGTDPVADGAHARALLAEAAASCTCATKEHT